MEPTPSPFAPASLPKISGVPGARIATAEAGVRYRNRPDVLLMVFDPGTAVAGVLTKSKCPSAPVNWCRDNLPAGRARALLVNAGNANAFTGMRGLEAVRATADTVAGAVGCEPSEVLLASTGVIGEPLDPSIYTGLVGGMVARVADDAWHDAARAIMTTDTYPKVAERTVMLGGTSITLGGIAKGSGMIAPDMATMLSFIATDAPLAPAVLDRLVRRHVESSFNSITVDSDTSTSDTVLAFATGAAHGRGAPRIDDPADRRLRGFSQALGDLMRDLAHQIVRDGEGARKFIEIRITGAASRKSARTIGLSVANSPLVKTAIAGEDANWGRLVMAVGKAGEPADRDRLAIWFGDTRVAFNGERDPAFSEDAVTAAVREAHVQITIDVGVGRSDWTVWTCDLTRQYVAINGDYRS